MYITITFNHIKPSYSNLLSPLKQICNTLASYSR